MPREISPWLTSTEARNAATVTNSPWLRTMLLLTWIWSFIVLWFEVGVFYASVRKCSWPVRTPLVSLALLIQKPTGAKQRPQEGTHRRRPPDTRPPLVSRTVAMGKIAQPDNDRPQYAEELESCVSTVSPRLRRVSG